jgi:WD40 repeat protein
MDYVPCVGADPCVSLRAHSTDALFFDILFWKKKRNPHPRLASSSKDASVRVWNTKTRVLEFAMGGHTASINVVRWGGEGVIYTASSDRTVKLWDAKDVGSPVFSHWI